MTLFLSGFFIGTVGGFFAAALFMGSYNGDEDDY